MFRKALPWIVALLCLCTPLAAQQVSYGPPCVGNCTFSGTTAIPTGSEVDIFNTADQTTNFERLRLFWVGNVATLETDKGGGGTQRTLALIQAAGGTLSMTSGSGVAGANNVNESMSSSGSAIWGVQGTLTASSGVQAGELIIPGISQTSSAGYTALLVNPTETSTGSGAKLLADFQVATVSKASIDDTGVIKESALNTVGSTPTLTGSCTTNTQVGGNTAGAFHATCTAQTVIITFAFTAANGWNCNTHDLTTPADALSQSSYTTNSCTLTGTTVAADNVTFDARAF